ncbi:MAG: integrase family protein [Parasphingorhabdus sp.]|uniref:integrase family protein n=1 Tax=Parasphingorhabdus sp. TaxID=2709688 RepID=UPI0030023494
MSHAILTDRTIIGLNSEKGRQKIVRDAELPGFFVMIGSRSKTFMVQGDLRQGDKRQSLRMKVGKVGKITTREARAKAKTLLGQISDGIDPRPKAILAKKIVASGRDPTLRVAWLSYRDSHMRRKGRSQKTEHNYADHVERLMARWLDKPLSYLGKDPALVKKRHDELTQECGPYMANGCMRTLRAIYNHARKSARDLPTENPVFAVDWNPERRRDSGMGPEDLPSWFEQLQKIANPVRRELHLFLLLSGSRPEVIKTARPDHLNLRDRVLYIPEPKGGTAKAFSIPLSRAMITCLLRVITAGRQMYPNQSEEWLFPAESATGHIVEHKENRSTLAYWGNELRQSYRTIGQSAGINEIDMHLLMNHSLPGVNAGYITRSKLAGGHLRSAQQSISSAIFEAVPQSGGKQKSWPFLSIRNIEKSVVSAMAKTSQFGC